MGIVFPVAGFRGTAPVEDVVARSLVGVPELVGSVCETVGELGGRSLDAQFCHHLQEGQVHIHIIVQAGILHEGLADVAVAPEDGFGILDEPALELEFGGAAVGAAYGLCEPSAADAVHHILFTHADGLPVFE